MYDAAVGRFFTQDRFAEKYLDFSPYQYAANNPINFIDVNGDSVDVASMQDENQQALVVSLEKSTGLNLSVVDGKVVYETNEKGKAVVNRDENGKKVGSNKARKAFQKAVNNENTLLVTDVPSKNGSFAITNENIINLDPMQIAENMGNMQGNPESLGWGMTFFHEFSHTEMGGSTLDPTPQTIAADPLGGAVKFTNRIRNQLGYSQRSQYNISVGQNSDGTRRATIHFNGATTHCTYSQDRSYGLTLPQYGMYINYLRR